MMARDFAASRRLFLDAADQARASIEHVVLEGSRAPDGTELAVDLASIIPSQEQSDWLVVVSGTHGIEGYVGSAIQSAWLQKWYGSPGRRCGVLMIHALNPFGMAWWSRGDRDGIDLNRNFLEFPQSLVNPGYERLHDSICGPSREALSLAALSEIFAAFEGQHGTQALTTALIGPQSTHADGMNFTGTAPSWSRLLLESVLDRFRKNGARRVMLIDLHAGVAPRGEVALLHFPSEAGDAERARRVWGSGLPGIGVGAQGLADYSGLLVQGAQRRLGSSIHAVVAEIGTVDRLTIREALRLDRWLRHHGDPLRDETVRERLIAAFCPRDPVWEEAAIRRGVGLLEFAMAGLTERWD